MFFTLVTTNRGFVSGPQMDLKRTSNTGLHNHLRSQGVETVLMRLCTACMGLLPNCVASCWASCRGLQSTANPCGRRRLSGQFIWARCPDACTCNACYAVDYRLQGRWTCGSPCYLNVISRDRRSRSYSAAKNSMDDLFNTSTASQQLCNISFHVILL